MYVELFSFVPVGVHGQVVRVEVDIRNGLPGVDIVGLPGDVVREARERVRVAIRNSGFEFPLGRVLVNLAPSDLRKVGACFDLPLALAILAASKQVPWDAEESVLVLGELNLAGRVSPVAGVIAAVGAGLKAGVTSFIVPVDNQGEALALGAGRVAGVATLAEAAARSGRQPAPTAVTVSTEGDTAEALDAPDLADLRGHAELRRALEVAAAGGHLLLLFGPPGEEKAWRRVVCQVCSPR